MEKEIFKKILNFYKSKFCTTVNYSDLLLKVNTDEIDDLVIYLMDNGVNVISEDDIGDVEDESSDDFMFDDSTAQYFKEISSIPVLPNDEVIQLFRSYHDENVSDSDKLEIRNKLVKHNLKLVAVVAKKYRNAGIDYIDLIQEGSIGLCLSIDKYDYTLGYRFSTYATWWIKQGITRSLANKARNIRIPVQTQALIYKLSKFKNTFYQEYYREPTYEEMADNFDISVDRVITLLTKFNDTTSLSTIVGDSEDSELIDFIADTDSLNIDDVVSKKEDKVVIEKMLEFLNDREADVVKRRYGFAPYNRRMTLEEIGKTYGCTRERIRQIEARGLRKLKSKFCNRYNYENGCLEEKNSDIDSYYVRIRVNEKKNK